MVRTKHTALIRIIDFVGFFGMAHFFIQNNLWDFEK